MQPKTGFLVAGASSLLVSVLTSQAIRGPSCPVRIFLLLLCLFFWQDALFAQAVAQPADKPLYAPSLIIAGPNDLAGFTVASEPGFPLMATVAIDIQSVSPRKVSSRRLL
jgi:hypothetical protein